MADFASALRQKDRFITARGTLSAEDLWDLPLTSTSGKADNLNSIAKELFAELRKQEEPDFVDNVLTKNTATSRKFEIVKYIIEVKKTERDLAERARARKAQDQKILEILNGKQDEALRSKSEAELRAMLAAPA
jgi:hypothetical protein